MLLFSMGQRLPARIHAARGTTETFTAWTPSAPPLWKVSLPDAPTGLVRVAQLRRVGNPDAIVSSLDGSLSVVDCGMGELRFRIELGEISAGCFAVLADRTAGLPGSICVISDAGRAQRLRGDDGKPIWSVDAEALTSATAPTLPVTVTAGARARSWRGMSVADLDRDGDQDFVSTRTDGLVAAFSGRDGHLLWSAAENGPARAITCEANGDGRVGVLLAVQGGPLRLRAGDTGRSLWEAAAGCAADATPAVDDGAQVVAALTEKGQVLAVSASEGRRLWSVPAPPGAVPQAAVGRLAGDGSVDVTVVGTGEVRCLLGSTGRIRWSRPLPRAHQQSAPLLDDVDGDGSPEIVIANMSLVALALSGADGHTLFEIPGVGAMYPGISVRLGPPQSNQRPILIGGRSNALEAFPLERVRMRWGFARAHSYWSIAVGDADGDGVGDVVTADELGHLLCVAGRTGRLVWSTPSRVTTRYPGGADLDGDGVLDLVCPTSEDALKAVSGRTGRDLWRAPDAHADSDVTVLADVDRDGVPDAVVHGKDGHFAACSGRDGRRIATYRTDGARSYRPSPALADADGDGALDLIWEHEGGDVVATSGRTGQTLWRAAVQAHRELPGPVALTGGASPGRVVVITKDRRLATLGLRTGAPESGPAFDDVPERSLGIPDVDGDACADLLVSSESRPMRAFSGATLLPLWTGRVTVGMWNVLPLGSPPSELFVQLAEEALLLDARTGQQRHRLNSGGAAILTGPGVRLFVENVDHGITARAAPAVPR